MTGLLEMCADEARLCHRPHWLGTLGVEDAERRYSRTPHLASSVKVGRACDYERGTDCLSGDEFVVPVGYGACALPGSPLRDVAE